MGCKLNFSESSEIARRLQERGFALSEQPETIIVNSCAVTATAEKKVRNLTSHLHKLSPDAQIVVLGCYAALRSEEILRWPGVAATFGNEDKMNVVPFLCGEPLSTNLRFSAAFSSNDRTRSFLKIQDGCDYHCTYCTVWKARGESRSDSIPNVLEQIDRIVGMGIKEVNLTGVNLGDFGRKDGSSFYELLRAIEERQYPLRFRISSIEPNLLSDEIIDWIASGTKVLPHFHIPLQSGSDTLLKRVGRRYDTALFASRIDRVREKMERPGGRKVFFGIDVIVGLPGETEDLFEETFTFLRDRIHPAFLHVFPYSKRPGTRAAAWPDQVQDSIKTQRVARLEALSDELRASLMAMKQTGMGRGAVYEVARLTYFGGRWVRHCGWYPDARVRLWQRGTAHWEGSVHEQLLFEVPVRTLRLRGDLLHYSYYSLSELAERQPKYYRLAAEEAYAQGRRASVAAVVLKPAWTFLRDYLLRGGFLDGTTGYVVCRMNAHYTFMKYATLREKLGKVKSKRMC